MWKSYATPLEVDGLTVKLNLSIHLFRSSMRMWSKAILIEIEQQVDQLPHGKRTTLDLKETLLEYNWCLLANLLQLQDQLSWMFENLIQFYN